VSIMTPCAFVIIGGRGLDGKQIRNGTRVTWECKVDRDRESWGNGMGLSSTIESPGWGILSLADEV